MLSLVFITIEFWEMISRTPCMYVQARYERVGKGDEYRPKWTVAWSIESLHTYRISSAVSKQSWIVKKGKRGEVGGRRRRMAGSRGRKKRPRLLYMSDWNLAWDFNDTTKVARLPTSVDWLIFSRFVFAFATPAERYTSILVFLFSFFFSPIFLVTFLRVYVYILYACGCSFFFRSFWFCTVASNQRIVAATRVDLLFRKVSIGGFCVFALNSSFDTTIATILCCSHEATEVTGGG